MSRSRAFAVGAGRPSPVPVFCGMMTAVNTEMLKDVWQRFLADSRKPWVLFEHGTCVVLTAPDGEPAEQAT